MKFILTSEASKKFKEILHPEIYALILWFVLVLNRLPREHKFTLGDRVTNELYEVLEPLVLAKFEFPSGHCSHLLVSL